jgi:hypothetical protein
MLDPNSFHVELLMAVRNKRINQETSIRIKRSEVVKRLQRDFGVTYPTALRWLSSTGPEPCARFGQTVYFWQHDIEAWLKARVA